MVYSGEKMVYKIALSIQLKLLLLVIVISLIVSSHLPGSGGSSPSPSWLLLLVVGHRRTFPQRPFRLLPPSDVKLVGLSSQEASLSDPQ